MVERNLFQQKTNRCVSALTFDPSLCSSATGCRQPPDSLVWRSILSHQMLPTAEQSLYSRTTGTVVCQSGPPEPQMQAGVQCLLQRQSPNRRENFALTSVVVFVTVVDVFFLPNAASRD